MSLVIKKGDLLEEGVDAIVVPINPKLELSGPLCHKVLEKCGDVLKEELSQLKTLVLTECAVVDSHHIDWKKIIFTVDPKYEDGFQKEEENLKKTYENIIDKALKFRLSSVAFPLLSTGAYKFPIDKAIKIALDVLSKKEQETGLNIVLVIYDQKTLDKCMPYLKGYKVEGEKFGVKGKNFYRLMNDERNMRYLYPDKFAKISNGYLKHGTFGDKIDFYRKLVQKPLKKIDCYLGIVSKSAFDNYCNEITPPPKDKIIAIGMQMGLGVAEIDDLLECIGEFLNPYALRDRIIIEAIEDGIGVAKLNIRLEKSGYIGLI